MTQKQYEVEAIVRDMIDPKSSKNKRIWEVKWKGYPSSANTWQERNTLSHLPLFQQYEKRRKERESQSQSTKKPKSKKEKTKNRMKRNVNDKTNKYKKSLLENTMSAQSTMDLISILHFVNISDIKQFIHQQIDNVLSNKSIKTAYFNTLPINEILPEDITQHILSFGHLNQNRTINKEWNKHLIQNKKIYFTKKYESDQTNNKNDNDAIFEDIETFKRKMYRKLDKLKCKYEAEKKQIETSYNVEIEKLKALSTRVCSSCNNTGNITLEKCIECGCNVCNNRCLAICGGSCESEQQYCYECCPFESCPGDDCNKMFCSECFSYYDQCEDCSERFCEDCVEAYTYYDDSGNEYSFYEEEDSPYSQVLLCKSCKEVNTTLTREHF